MTVIIIVAALIVFAMGVGFAFGRNYEAERWMKRRAPGAMIDLDLSEWSRVNAE
jgi:hypothetical protein